MSPLLQGLDAADPVVAAQVFEEVEPKLLHLTVDVFGNYGGCWGGAWGVAWGGGSAVLGTAAALAVMPGPCLASQGGAQLTCSSPPHPHPCPPSVVQKLLECGGEEVRQRILAAMRGHVLLLSLQMYGCRVVQKALEVRREGGGRQGLCVGRGWDGKGGGAAGEAQLGGAGREGQGAGYGGMATCLLLSLQVHGFVHASHRPWQPLTHPISCAALPPSPADAGH